MRAEETFSITVGRLLCRYLRDYLGARKLRCPELRWHEGSGWIEREFTIVAPTADADAIKRDLVRWADQIQQAKG